EGIFGRNESTHDTAHPLSVPEERFCQVAQALAIRMLHNGSGLERERIASIAQGKRQSGVLSTGRRHTLVETPHFDERTSPISAIGRHKIVATSGWFENSVVGHVFRD